MRTTQQQTRLEHYPAPVAELALRRTAPLVQAYGATGELEKIARASYLQGVQDTMEAIQKNPEIAKS